MAAAPITTYTTYADVRAALGVSDDDLEDTTLGLELYANYLEVELEDVNIDLPTTYATTEALGTPTAAEERFLKSCRLFATFAVARQLTSALPIFAAQQVSDGKASVQRFDTPYKDAIKSVNEQYDRLKNRLVQSLASIGTSTSAATAMTYVSVVSPAVDPVTGV